MEILEFLLDVKRIPYWDRTPAIDDVHLDELIEQIRAILGEDEDHV